MLSMRKKRYFSIIITSLIGSLGLGSFAFSQTESPLPPLEPFNLQGVYNVSWSGLGVGNLVILAHEDAKTYGLEAHVKARGIAYSFTKHESMNKVEGIKAKEKYIPQRFETIFTLRKNTRHIILSYNKKGELVNEENTPPENRQKRPEVPMELKKHVMDIMTILFYQRGELYKALQNNQPSFTYRMYDGRRLTDITVNVKGRQEVSWQGKQVKVIAFGIDRKAIAGFKQSELEELEKDNDPNIAFYLSDDGKLTPLRIVVDAEAGAFYANFERHCESKEACLKVLD